MDFFIMATSCREYIVLFLTLCERARMLEVGLCVIVDGREEQERKEL